MGCVRCGGTGVLLQHLKVDGGTCFRCGGSGIDPKEMKLLKDDVYKEKIIGGRKVMIKVRKDSNGRFAGYSVTADGVPFGVTCSNIKEATNAFDRLANQLKVPW